MRKADMSPRSLLVAVAIIVIAFVAAAFFFFARPMSLPGTLTFYTAEAWTAPNGETFQGLVSYNLSTGKTLQLYPPAAPFGRFVLTHTLSPDGDQIFAVAPSSLEEGAGLVLGSLSISKQDAVRTFIGYDSGSFVNPIWSPSMGAIAYAVIGLSERREPMLFITPTYETQPEYGIGTPIAFSSDDLFLVVREDLALVVMNVLNGERIPVRGLENLFGVDRVIMRPGGTRLALVHDSGAVSFFTFDWGAKHATPAGTLPEGTTRDTHIAFNAEEEVLFLRDGQAYIYTLKNGEYIPNGAHRLKLPKNADVVTWQRN